MQRLGAVLLLLSLAVIARAEKAAEFAGKNLDVGKKVIASKVPAKRTQKVQMTKKASINTRSAGKEPVAKASATNSLRPGGASAPSGSDNGSG